MLPRVPGRLSMIRGCLNFDRKGPSSSRMRKSSVFARASHSWERLWCGRHRSHRRDPCRLGGHRSPRCGARSAPRMAAFLRAWGCRPGGCASPGCGSWRADRPPLARSGRPPAALACRSRPASRRPRPRFSACSPGTALSPAMTTGLPFRVGSEAGKQNQRNQKAPSC